MEKISKKGELLLTKLFNNFEVISISIMVLIGPFVVNYNDLPKGYEVTKVFFFQISTVILIGIFLLKQIVRMLENHKDMHFGKSFWVLLFTVLIILITTLFTPFNSNASLDEIVKSVPVIGNPFRFQGAYTHILMVCFTFIVYKSVNKRNILLVFGAFLISSFIQALVAIGQLNYFLVNDFKVIFEGYYINGTFGQANFFSGRITLGILASMLFISYGSNFLHNKKWNSFVFNLVLYFLIPLATLILIIALVASFSTWGIITAGILVLTVIIYEVVHLLLFKNSSTLFGKIFGVSLITGLILATYLIAQMYIDQIDNLRLHIWKNIYNLSTNQPFSRVLIGYGYDTLGDVFRSFGIFQGIYVDRAHNFFLDILMQNGLISLAGSLILIVISTLKFIFKKSSIVLTYTFLGMFFWLFRSFVHESGIVNLYDFLILFAATWALQKDIGFQIKLPSRLVNKFKLQKSSKTLAE